MTSTSSNVAEATAPKTLDEAYKPEKITKQDVRSVALRWMFSNTSCWGYERMMGISFCWSLIPLLQKLYKREEDFKAALQRHTVFFNTEMTVGTPIIGAVAALEEEKANGGAISDDMIDAVKTGLMGPLAALGDSLFGSTINALLLSFCMGIAADGNALGPILFTLIWTALVVFVTIWGANFGYTQGVNIMDSDLFSEATMAKVTKVLSVLGLVVIGGMAAGFIAVSTPLSWTVGEATTSLQGILDTLMPGLLPLITVLLAWYLHSYKNVSVTKLLLGMVAVGAACSLFGIL